MIKEYNRALALKYASRWAYKRNPYYYDYSAIGGDCTNFISQCLYSGGMIMNYTQTFGWYYRNANSKSPSWSGVEYLWNFLVSGKVRTGPFGTERDPDDAENGDIIQLSFDGTTFAHTLIVTGRSHEGILIATHTYDAYNKPLSEYGYEKIRCVHIEGSYY